MSEELDLISSEEEYDQELDLDPELEAEKERLHYEWQAQRWAEEQANLEREERESRYGAALEMCDLMRRDKPSVRAYCPKFIYAGGITVLAADPKMGKTTFALRQAHAISQGAAFLGTDCSKANVLYATEQNLVTYQEQAEKYAPLRKGVRGMFAITVERNHRISVNDKDGKHELIRKPIKNWQDQIQFWREYLDKTRSKVLIVDTLLSFARMKPAESNDPGAISQLFFDLRELYNTVPELGIQMLHHCRKEDQRKGGNAKRRDFSDIAGSFGFRGGTDQNIIMYAERGVESRLRDIKIEGRFMQPNDLRELEVRLADDDGEMTLDTPLTWQPKRDPQEIVREKFIECPILWNMSYSAAAEAIGVTKYQVELFRKHNPKPSDQTG